MYQQPKAIYSSNDSVRRLSSNNPFRSSSDSSGVQIPQSQNVPPAANAARSPNTRFNDWVEKNKQLIESSDDEDPYDDYNLISSYGNHSTDELSLRPNARSDSDPSNALGGHSHHRDPPHVPTTNGTAPARPPKTATTAKPAPPPPSYEEAAGKEAARRDYPREKSGSSSSSRRPHAHRSNSDSSRHYESSRYKGSGKEREKEKEKERARRHRHKSKKSPKKPEPVKSKNLDTIDKLDVTAFFGGGFHHDGPYDALTNHRNKNVKAAPVKAFPIDGPNNSLKGNVNVGTNEQMNMAFGYADQNEIVGRRSSTKKKLTSKSSDDLLLKTNRGADPNDLTSSLYTPRQNPSVINFDVNVKAEPVHGSLTAGLGSTTFVDGAPAPKHAQDEYLSSSNGGLGRKKSLVQRLRGNSGSDHNSRRSSNENMDRVKTNYSEEEPSGNSLLRRVKSLKVGRR